MNAELFLKKYRILEELLEKRYAGKRTESSSVVIEYLRDPDSVDVRSDLDMMRALRNLLTHNSDERGEPVAEPSDSTVARLQQILDYINRPRLAKDFATPASKLLCASPRDELRTLIPHMKRCGYSHVPVLDHGKFLGVFSIKCVFYYIAENGFEGLSKSSRVEKLKDSIRIEQRDTESYRFMPESTTIYEAREAFQAKQQRNNRLAAIFLTATGLSSEPLIGMLTPWDVLDNTPQKE